MTEEENYAGTLHLKNLFFGRNFEVISLDVDSIVNTVSALT
jgi:hypothetical protein